MTDPKPGARQKILEAADAIARQAGPANLSLDMVAARAGVSKGGLLYHFPSKARLLEALVEQFLTYRDEALKEKERACDGAPDSVARAYLDLSLEDHKRPPSSGLLAALGENPDFLDPVRRYERMFLDRMKANASDPTMATIVFLTLHGVRSMQLLNMELLDSDELEDVADKLRELTGG